MNGRRDLDSSGHEMEGDLVSASSCGSMSDYGSDLEDVELELRRDKTRPVMVTRCNMLYNITDKNHNNRYHGDKH